MTGWVYVGIISVGLIGWAFVLEDRIDYEHRLAAWWVDGAPLLSGPAMLAYAPVVRAMAPTDSTAYTTWRSHLAAAGADPGQQRAIAWGAGPPALAGFGAVLFTLFTIFGV